MSAIREPLEPLIEGYLAYLTEVSRKQPRTVIDVRCTLGRVSQALARLRPGVPLWKLKLEDYLCWLEQERTGGRSEACLAKYLSHLRGLLDYAWRSGRSERNVLDGFQVQDHSHRREPSALTVEEARRLVEACPKITPQERQERAALLLLYGCGLRTQELCDLNVADVDSQRSEVFVRRGKGDRERVVPIPPAVLPEVLALMLERGGRRGPLLRTVAKRRRWASKDVCEVVRRAAVLALSEADFGALFGSLRALGDPNTGELMVWRASGKYLADAVAMKALGLAKCGVQVAGYIEASCAALTSETKAQWAAKVREAFVPDQAAVAAMGDEEFAGLLQLLGALGDSQTQGLWLWRANKYMANAATVKALGLPRCCQEVSGWLEHCGPALTAEMKQDWATKIRAAFAADQATVAALSDGAFANLIQLLGLVGGTDVAALNAWRVESKSQGDAATVRSVGLNELASHVRASSGSWSAETKGQWIAKLRGAYAADQAAVTALTDADLDLLANVLGVLGDEQVPALRLSYASNKYMIDAATIKSLGLETCRSRVAGWVAACGPALTVELKQGWAAKVRAAFAGDGAAVGALGAKDFVALNQLLTLLGDAATPQLTALWMTAGTAWKSSDAQVLTLLAEGLDKLGKTEGDAARLALAEHLTALCSQQRAAAVALGTEQWATLARYLRNAVPADKRLALAAALRGAFAGDRAALSNLRPRDFQCLIDALNSLGDPKVDELKRDWTKLSETWQADDPLGVLANLPLSGDEQSVTVRQKLAQQIEARYLASGESIRAVDLSTWIGVVEALRPVLSPTSSARWAEKLGAAFAGEVTGAEPDSWKPAAILRMLASLGGATSGTLAQTYLTANQERLGDLAAQDLFSLVALAAGKDRQAAQALMAKAETVWSAKFSAGTMTLGDCGCLCTAWVAASDWAKAKSWALRAYGQALGSEEARAAATQDTLHGLVGMFADLGLWGKSDQEYPALAATAARLAREGKLKDIGGWVSYQYWGLMLQAPQSRATVQAALKDDAGVPRVEVAKILAWAYRAGRESKVWSDLVDAELKARGDENSDAKALWLVVKGYTRGVVSEVDLKNIRRGKPYLDQALAAAQSEAVRLAVVEALAGYWCDLEHPEYGLQMLESVRGQFPGSQAALVAVEQKLEETGQSLQAASAHRKMANQTARERSRLAYFKECLAREQAHGEAASVARLQGEVRQLEAKVGAE